MNERQVKRLEFAKNSVWKAPVIQIDKSAVIHRSSLIGVSGFGYSRDLDGSLVKINHAGGVKVEANVEIRAFCTIDRATIDGVFTTIGEGNKIDHHCHFAHNTKIGKWNTFANGCVIEGSCEVGDFNTFGTNVIMQTKTKVGSNCIIGSGAVITKDIPDNSVVVGNPSKVIRENI
jgi:UDP-3-O-[3-hydroxymyristoyl] glucosamine N-acyltransferase